MASFKRALEKCSDDFLTSMAVSAEQIEAARVHKPVRRKFKAADLDLGIAYPITKDDLDLARRVNEFFAERPAA